MITMPNAPKVRVVTTVPFDHIIDSCRQEIMDAAISNSGITIAPADIEKLNTKMSKGKNGIKVVITID
jgi:hypothetical protein